MKNPMLLFSFLAVACALALTACAEEEVPALVATSDLPAFWVAGVSHR